MGAAGGIKGVHRKEKKSEKKGTGNRRTINFIRSGKFLLSPVGREEPKNRNSGKQVMGCPTAPFRLWRETLGTGRGRGGQGLKTRLTLIRIAWLRKKAPPPAHTGVEKSRAKRGKGKSIFVAAW